jgi:hypothetical protein
MPFRADPNMHLPNHDVSNQQVVQAGEQPYHREPSSFFEAVSEIQQLSVVEQKAREQVDQGYFTLSQRYNYFKIGMKTGLIESFILMMAFPLLIHIVPASLVYFSNIKISKTALLVMDAISYGFLAVVTIIFLSLIRFYVGPLSRYSIFWLFIGRTFSLVLKSIITFLLYGWIFQISYSKPMWVYVASDWIAFAVNGLTSLFWLLGIIEQKAVAISGMQFYYFYYQLIAPIVVDMSKTVIMSFLVAGALPLASIMIKRFLTLNKQESEERKFENY